jgi:hypothetical protein
MEPEGTVEKHLSRVVGKMEAKSITYHIYGCLWANLSRESEIFEKIFAAMLSPS